MFDGDPSVYLWASGSAYVDDTSETSPVVQVGALTGRFVREGYAELATIANASGNATLLTVAVPESTSISGEVDLTCFTSAHVISGPLLFEAHRVGSAAPVLSSSKGAPWVNTRPDTLPRVALNGNNIQVLITSDPYYEIRPRITSRVSMQSIVGAAAPDLKALYRAEMIATGDYKQLYFPDLGVTLDTGLVTTQLDQSGNAHTLTSVAGNRATLANDGTFDYLQIRKDVGVLMSAAGAGQALSDRTLRWTMRPAGDVFGVTFARNNENVYTSAAAWNTNGTHTFLVAGGTEYDAGAQLAGWHNYEYRIDATNGRAYFLLDGVAVSDWAIGATAPNGAMMIGYNGAGTLEGSLDLAGWGLQEGVGTAEETALWIAMAEASGWTA